MKSRIGILIHFNLNAKPLTPCMMAEYLQNVVSCAINNSNPFQITIETRTSGSFSSKTVETNGNALLLDKLIEYINPETCYISIEAINSTAALLAYGCITRSHALTQFMIGREQTIFMLVDEKLWCKRSAVLIEQIQAMCANDLISYVAIDFENILPRSIYTANLRLLSSPRITSTIDPESRVPGIYWAQFIGNSMLTQEVKKKAIDIASGGHCNYVCKDIGTGLWIQTTSDIKTDSSINQRAVYEVLELEKLSYAVDEQIMERYLLLQPWLFKKFPIRISV